MHLFIFECSSLKFGLGMGRLHILGTGIIGKLAGLLIIFRVDDFNASKTAVKYALHCCGTFCSAVQIFLYLHLC